MTASQQELVQAYRAVYKHLLRAVQYSKPARFVVQDRVRTAFRKSAADEFDRVRFERTLEFLDGAAKAKGLEHKIVKNLMHVWWEQKKLVSSTRTSVSLQNLVSSIGELIRVA